MHFNINGMIVLKQHEVVSCHMCNWNPIYNDTILLDTNDVDHLHLRCQEVGTEPSTYKGDHATSSRQLKYEKI